MQPSRFRALGLLACAAASTGCWRSAGSSDEPGACATSADCQEDQRCSPLGLCVCAPDLCMGSDWLCHVGDGVGDAFCGFAGEACAPCPPEQACLERACVPEECTCARETVTCLDEHTEQRCNLDDPECGVLETTPCEQGCAEPDGCVELPCLEPSCDPSHVVCVGPTIEQRCVQGDDGCWRLAPETDCDEGETCLDGVGCAPCTDLCVRGRVQCQGTERQKCAPGPSGCLEWVTEEDCADSHLACDDSTSSAQCVCQEHCNPGTVLSCVPDAAVNGAVDLTTCERTDSCAFQLTTTVACVDLDLTDANILRACVDSCDFPRCADDGCDTRGLRVCDADLRAFRECVLEPEDNCLTYDEPVRCAWYEACVDDPVAGIVCFPCAEACNPESAAYPVCGASAAEFGYTDCVDSNDDGCAEEVWVDCFGDTDAALEDCQTCAEIVGLEPCNADQPCELGEWECSAYETSYRVCVAQSLGLCLEWGVWDTCPGLDCDESAPWPCP